MVYRIYCIYSEPEPKDNSNSVDPDEKPKYVASYQDLHCLPLIQQFLNAITGNKLYLFRFLIFPWK